MEGSWGSLLGHFERKRVVLSILAAVPVIGLGTWLLRYEVSQQNIPSEWARGLNLPLITFLSYTLNRRVIWKDAQTSWLRGLGRYSIVSVGHASITWSIFALLVTLAGLNHLYLYVNIALIVLFCPASYLLYKVWTFVVERRDRLAETIGP